MPDAPGKFIVLDGNEGCGKSTQAKLLHDELIRGGHDVLLVRDPGTTAVGEQIRAILLNPTDEEMSMRCEMLLYMAARAQMVARVIRPALDAGKIVISDRFVSSTLAYQLGGDGLTFNDIRSVAEVAIADCRPNLTILLDMPPAIGFARMRDRAKDRIEMRPIAYHEQVRQNYLAQAAHDPQRYRVIDAGRSKESVSADVVRAANAVVGIK